MQLPRDIRRLLASYSLILAYVFEEYDLLKGHEMDFYYTHRRPVLRRGTVTFDVSKKLWRLKTYDVEDVQVEWVTYSELIEKVNDKTAYIIALNDYPIWEPEHCSIWYYFWCAPMSTPKWPFYSSGGDYNEGKDEYDVECTPWGFRTVNISHNKLLYVSPTYLDIQDLEWHRKSAIVHMLAKYNDKVRSMPCMQAFCTQYGIPLSLRHDPDGAYILLCDERLDRCDTFEISRHVYLVPVLSKVLHPWDNVSRNRVSIEEE